MTTQTSPRPTNAARPTPADPSGPAVAAPPEAGTVPVPPIGGGTAHAKAILLGEHSVVYGHPAIAVPLHALTVRATAESSDASWLDSALYTGPLAKAPERLSPVVTAVRATLAAFDASDTDLLLRVRGDIPIERGLGSSAAVAAATVSAVAGVLGAELDDRTHHDLIQAAERAAHGTPSGLDARGVRAEGPIWFASGEVAPIQARATLDLVIADSGRRGRTRQAVDAVRQRREDAPHPTDAMLAELGDLTRAAAAALQAGHPRDLGDAMNRAHDLLVLLGVSDPALDTLVTRARAGDALGAKLTGGGMGGCVLALARDRAHAQELADMLRTTGATAWTTTIEATA